MEKTKQRPEEVALKAKMLYEQNVQPQLTENDRGKFVIIEVESGDYEIDRDRKAASDRVHARHSDGMFFAFRIGYPAATKSCSRFSRCHNAFHALPRFED